MLSPTPHQQFLAPRVAKAHGRLAELMWCHDVDLTSLSRSTPTHEHRRADEVADDEFASINLSTLPIAWGRKWQQCWWTLELPKPTDDRPRFLRWRDQAEATVYIPEKGGWRPWYGIDPGHHHAPIPAGTTRIRIESTCCRTGVWVTGERQGISDRGSLFEGACLETRDDDAWHAWHDLDVLIGLCKLLYRQALPQSYGSGGAHGGGEMGDGFFNPGGYRTAIEVAPPLLRKLLHRLNEAVNAFDRDGPAAMRRQTEKIIADFPAEPWAGAALLTGHAHIDLVWKWPERVGEFKAVHSFATADTLMEAYPEFHFGYSQPASYEAVEKRSPALMRRVGKRIKSGKWEPTGAMYVESDTQLPCGEALVRAVDLGQEGFRQLTGKDSSVLWLPDVFGYSAAIPQILAGFGVPYFFTTKLHWSGATRFPHSGFRWRGHDGSEVVGFIAWEHYNLAATPREIKWAAENQRQAAVFDEALVPVGYGDGGGGVNESMCERVRRMADIATLPRTKWGRIDGFFDRLAKVKKDLPAWRGEMYLEFHRGVQTTHSNLKQAYRAAERGLQVHEAVHCATGKGPIDARPWKRVCFAQFHDYLPGSSIQEVYDEGVPELNRIAETAISGATTELSGGATSNSGATASPSGEAVAPGASLFNPLPVERTVLTTGGVFRVPPLTGVAAASLDRLEAPAVTRRRDVMENGRVKIRLTEDGRIGEMSVDGHPLALSAPACGLVFFPDHPAVYDAWDIERPTLSIGELVQTPMEADFDGDDLRQVASFTRKVGRKSTATLRYILEAASPVVRVEMEINWQDPQALLKAIFPTDYAGQDARYGAPFGSVMRPQFGNTVGDDARFETPASRWMTLSDATEREGLMLISKDRYGMGCRDGLAHLSLVRSALVTDADDNPDLRDWAAYGGTGRDRFSDLGTHRIEFAFGLFRADSPRSEQPATLADTLYTPCVPFNGTDVSAGLMGIDGGDSVHAAWARPEVDGWTLRLSETLGRRGHLRLRLAPGLSATRTDLRGREIAPVEGGEIAFTPYELISVKIHP